MKRFLVILLAYYLASLGAVNTAIVLGMSRDLANGSPGDVVGEAMFLAGISILVAIIIGIAASVQSLLVIALGAAMELRNWLYYSFAGAFCGAVFAVMMAGRGMFPPMRPPSPGILDHDPLIWMISGFVGGFVYWAVAVMPRNRNA